MKPTSDAAVLRRMIAGVMLSATITTLTACPYGTELDNKAEFLGPSEGGGCDRAPLILESACGGEGLCHKGKEGATPWGGVELVAPGFEAMLRDRDATYPYVADSENCPTEAEHIVETSNPDSSLLTTKLRGTHSCGEPMPIGAAALDEADIVCLEAWVKQLAAQGAL